MTIVHCADAKARSSSAFDWKKVLTPVFSRVFLATIVIGAVAVTFTIADITSPSPAAVNAGDDLTRLLRFMALIKGFLAAGAVGAVLWRLGSEVSLGRFVAYSAVCALMAMGPGLIWNMEHVGVGALLLHGGLIAALVLLWRDPAVPARLEAALIRRRS